MFKPAGKADNPHGVLSAKRRSRAHPLPTLASKIPARLGGSRGEEPDTGRWRVPGQPWWYNKLEASLGYVSP